MGKAVSHIKKASIQDLNKNSFEDFITEIKKGNVLLIVGKNFEINLDSRDVESDELLYVDASNLYSHILNKLNYIYNTNAVDFSELAFDENFRYENSKVLCNIHQEIVRVLNECHLDENDVSPSLIQLIETGYFKFVFTTTFDPLVELAMKKKWGETGFRIMSILDIDNRDIKEESDIEKPTLYYLFGKAGAKGQKFVATDNDALRLLSIWQRDMHNSKLLSITSSKFLLTLGCDYDDWLFRFIWHTLKDGENINRGYVSEILPLSSLEKYLMRNKILIDNDSKILCNKILNELEKSKKDDLASVPDNKCDVFISYSRADSDIAEGLYNALTSAGLTVWYDKYDLGGRGQHYMSKIFTAIEKSRLFIPILTDTITKQFGEPHPYRQEWKKAEEVQTLRGEQFLYCWPVVVNYDLDEACANGELDPWIKEKDARLFYDKLDLESLAHDVKTELDKMEKKYNL